MQIAGVKAQRVNLANPGHHKVPKVWQLPDWKSLSHPARVKALRKIAMMGGRDPRMATLAVSIFRKAGAAPRAYISQASALLKFIHQHIYYANEPGERLQDPFYTLKVGYGDCDDLAILLGALYESVRLPWRFVLSGKRGKKIVRWVEGTPYIPAQWSHIYIRVGVPPFRPTKWFYAEPTLTSAKLGWDVVMAAEKGEKFLPELSGPQTESVEIVKVEKGKKAKKTILEELREQLSPRRVLVLALTGAVLGLSQEAIKNLVKGWFNGK